MEFGETHIYRRALVLIDLTALVLDELPVGAGFLADQLRRASSSILLNFAEGYGKNSKRDQRRFFMIARGSTNEVAAILDVAFRFGFIKQGKRDDGHELCDHIARMLTRFRR